MIISLMIVMDKGLGTIQKLLKKFLRVSRRACCPLNYCLLFNHHQSFAVGILSLCFPLP